MAFSTYDDILRDQAKRKNARKALMALAPPIDLESLAEYQKRFKELEAERYDACWLVDWHIDVLRKAVELALGAERMDELQMLVGEAAGIVPLDVKLREKAAEVEAREAARTGDVPGQLKMPLDGEEPQKGKGRGKKGKVKDDGSVAEAAGPCSTSKLEEAEKSDGLKQLEAAAEK